MIARGEIGFLVSALAESKGIFGTETGEDNSPIFLVVTWAIMLCTIIGPLMVGALVNRVKKLQRKEQERQGGSGNREGVLGPWGIN